jgi:hypothetical protein
MLGYLFIGNSSNLTSKCHILHTLHYGRLGFVGLGYFVLGWVGLF